MTNRRTLRQQLFVASLLLAGLVTPGLAQAPSSAGSDVALAVGGVSHALTLTAADLKGMPRTTVSISEDGREVKYEGVLVGEVLKRAGAPLGRDLTGQALATYVLASAKDGYQAVFSIAELDPAFTPNDIIIADSVDGKPLFTTKGRSESSRRTTSEGREGSACCNGSMSYGSERSPRVRSIRGALILWAAVIVASRLSGAIAFEGRRENERAEGDGGFHDAGLYNLAGTLSYPLPNTGVYEIKKCSEDVGRFKVPTLRNVAVTAPYMHDGSSQTLTKRSITTPPADAPSPMDPIEAWGTTTRTRAPSSEALH